MRLIDADALREEIARMRVIVSGVRNGKGLLCELVTGFCKAILKAIDDAPTIDAVPVVRCKDCKYYEIHRPKVLENCERDGRLIPMSPDDFCSYGERRSDD